MLTILAILSNVTTILGAYLTVYITTEYVHYLKSKKSNN